MFIKIDNWLDLWLKNVFHAEKVYLMMLALHLFHVVVERKYVDAVTVEKQE